MSQEGRVALRASSAPPDSTPVWVDITAFIEDERSSWSVATGRQTTLSRAEPARLTLTLNNADHRFTPGNTSSPYHPWWTQGCRLQLQETIGPWSSEYPDFFLELPDVLINEPGVDQTVTVNAVDRLGRLQSARRFTSTLAAHIQASGKGDLVRYWPLHDAGQYSDLIAGEALNPIVLNGVTYGTTLAQGVGPVAFADDVSGLSVATREGTSRSQLGLFSGEFLTLPAGQTVTLVAWVRPIDPDTASAFVDILSVQTVETPSASGYFPVGYASGVWGASALFGNLTGSITSTRSAASDFATPIAVRFGYTPNVFECWIGSDRFIGSLSGSAPSAVTLIDTWMPRAGFRGDIAHAQLYRGSAWGYEDYLAQIDVGLHGLERQHTGDRVRAIAAYAGLPAGEVDADQGVASMSRAQLAGKDPLTALREAENTEQGRLFCAGPNVTFHDRRRRYDI